MEVIFIVLPLAIVMAAVALAAFFWAVSRGQFDDLDTPRYRALFDEPSVRRNSAARIARTPPDPGGGSRGDTGADSGGNSGADRGQGIPR